MTPAATTRGAAELAAPADGDADQRRWASGWRRVRLPRRVPASTWPRRAGVGRAPDGAGAVARLRRPRSRSASAYLVALPAGWADGTPFWWLYGAAGRRCSPSSCRSPTRTPRDVRLRRRARRGGAAAARAAPIVAGADRRRVFVPPLIPSLARRRRHRHGVTICLVTARHVRLLRAHPGQPRADRGPGRGGPAGRRGERNRIARDLHDLLGHSLTTITVKAGLADRLAEPRPGPGRRARSARSSSWPARALADVRAAVAGYREVTLAGELATAREVLRAAGIEADLPRVDRRRRRRPSRAVRLGGAGGPDQRGAPRPGHARARSRVGADLVEIADDGAAAAAPRARAPGLRERVAAAGGSGRRRRRSAAVPRRLAAAGRRRRDRSRRDGGPTPGDGDRRRRGRGRGLMLACCWPTTRPSSAGARRPAGPGGGLRGRGRGRPGRRGGGRGRRAPARRRPARHRDARARRPGGGGRAAPAEVPGCRVLILTTFGRAGYLRRAMEAGAWASWSRTRRPSSWPTPSGGWPPASGSSTRRWPRPPWPAGRRR